MEGRTKQFDGLTGLTLTPPLILRQIYATGPRNKDLVYKTNLRSRIYWCVATVLADTRRQFAIANNLLRLI